MIATLLLAAAAASAPRDYCPERPGLNTTPCIIDKGRVSVETSLADWTRDDGEDRLLVADTLVRLGVTDTVEVQLGWTPFGRVRAAGATRRGVGDVELGLSANLHNPDGTGFSLALQPRLTLPVGRQPVGDGDWSAQLLVPFSYDLSDAVTLAATPELDAEIDGDGHGRHLRFGTVIGVEVELSEAVSLEPEMQLIRDDDPGGRSTQALASLSLAWKARPSLQFDLQAVAGLNAAAPDVQLLGGVAARF